MVTRKMLPFTRNILYSVNNNSFREKLYSKRKEFLENNIDIYRSYIEENINENGTVNIDKCLEKYTEFTALDDNILSFVDTPYYVDDKERKWHTINIKASVLTRSCNIYHYIKFPITGTLKLLGNGCIIGIYDIVKNEPFEISLPICSCEYTNIHLVLIDENGNEINDYSIDVIGYFKPSDYYEMTSPYVVYHHAFNKNVLRMPMVNKKLGILYAEGVMVKYDPNYKYKCKDYIQHVTEQIKNHRNHKT